MKHEMLIWATNKETGKGHRIVSLIEITESDIEELALSKYEYHYGLDEDKTYSASIDKTII